MEAANEWGWVLPERMSEYETQRKHKTKHVMAKDAPADICESFMYALHGAVWWMKRQRTAGRFEEVYEPPNAGTFMEPLSPNAFGGL